MILGTFFTITSNDVASTTAYAGNIVSDLMPLLVVIIGVIIGLFIVRSILRLKD